MGFGSSISRCRSNVKMSGGVQIGEVQLGDWMPVMYRRSQPPPSAGVGAGVCCVGGARKVRLAVSIYRHPCQVPQPQSAFLEFRFPERDDGEGDVGVTRGVGDLALKQDQGLAPWTVGR